MPKIQKMDKDGMWTNMASLHHEAHKTLHKKLNATPHPPVVKKSP